MLHTKSQGHRPSGSGEEDFLRVFTIYGRGGHLGHVTKTIWTNFCSPILRSLHMKYEFNWPSSFRGEDVWKCWRTDDGRTDGRRTDDGRRSHWYTISSPMSLRLRWAKNLIKSSFHDSPMLYPCKFGSHLLASTWDIEHTRKCYVKANGICINMTPSPFGVCVCVWGGGG